ncbi:GNAT family N-acetyltransferase [Parasphingorhabdus sp.]|uniref:GNAT family N-acetyltransferase n=1 Tax=Parasphingorhabdus sp. TaxID=2709688 RepID=UPI003D29BB87
MFAVTPRLLLRPGWPEDAPALNQAINDKAIISNLARAPWPYAMSDAHKFLSLPNEASSPRWLIFQRQGGAPMLVGCIGIDRMESGDVELGYWIGRDHWGRGFATEAGGAVLQNARSLGHQKLVASHFIDNPVSGSVLRKLGFQPTGQTVPRFSLGRDGLVDAVEYVCMLGTKTRTDHAESLAA